jgi:hypothetical protein
MCSVPSPEAPAAGMEGMGVCSRDVAQAVKTLLRIEVRQCALPTAVAPGNAQSDGRPQRRRRRKYELHAAQLRYLNGRNAGVLNIDTAASAGNVSATFLAVIGNRAKGALSVNMEIFTLLLP